MPFRLRLTCSTDGIWAWQHETVARSQTRTTPFTRSHRTSQRGAFDDALQHDVELARVSADEFEAPRWWPSGVRATRTARCFAPRSPRSSRALSTAIAAWLAKASLRSEISDRRCSRPPRPFGVEDADHLPDCGATGATTWCDAPRSLIAESGKPIRWHLLPVPRMCTGWAEGGDTSAMGCRRRSTMTARSRSRAPPHCSRRSEGAPACRSPLR